MKGDPSKTRKTSGRKTPDEGGEIELFDTHGQGKGVLTRKVLLETGGVIRTYYEAQSLVSVWI